ncbi:hypothetical protein [Comamonas aquatica]|uniref:hypothetical protein n=1 Tax=Comamonas aquatica TaxID=225991 RepID=UPI00244C8EEE|nr:hypothetical protein [Comamonas aquatica]MDH0380639.1 hypothetical protein [Comamonas aquatica]MDH0429178.1 hypothetical protein [Comamonas aquatica]MDH0940042.1 hypothetical protein [Comamonas aquatica]MDH1904141.1 hypothetical protein [Comamonas aquatica]
MPAKRTEPSRSALNPAHGFKYTPSNSTNLAKRFAEIRRAQAKAARDAAKALEAEAQAQLELAPAAVVLPIHRKACAQ